MNPGNIGKRPEIDADRSTLCSYAQLCAGATRLADAGPLPRNTNRHIHPPTLTHARTTHLWIVFDKLQSLSPRLLDVNEMMRARSTRLRYLKMQADAVVSHIDRSYGESR